MLPAENHMTLENKNGGGGVFVKQPSIQVRLYLIFPLIPARLARGLKQIPLKVTEACAFYETFLQRSGLKVIDEQTQWVYTAKRCSWTLKRAILLLFVRLMYHTGNCIRRFGGIYAYCRYFIDR